VDDFLKWLTTGEERVIKKNKEAAARK